MKGIGFLTLALALALTHYYILLKTNTYVLHILYWTWGLHITHYTFWLIHVIFIYFIIWTTFKALST